MHTVKTSLKRAAAIAGLATIGVMLGAPVAASAAPSVYECHGCREGPFSKYADRDEHHDEQHSHEATSAHHGGTGMGQVAGVGGTLALAAVGRALQLRNRRRNAAE